MKDTEIVVSTPLRTAIGTFGGLLKDTPATDLGTTVVKAILERTGLDPQQIDQIIVGNVLQAGQGMNPGRQVAIKAGLPVQVPGMTINRVCGSGLQAVISAAQEVLLDTADVVLAGGMENMDQAPFLLPKARYGYRMAMPSAELIDSMVYDGLWDIFNTYHMGTTAENVAKKYGVSREEQDAFAVRSHQRAAAAMREGLFTSQIVPVALRQKNETVEFTQDEHVRMNATPESMAKLKPVFDKQGSVTAGNASGINDGAGFMLVTSAAKAKALGLPVAGRLVSYAVTGVDPAYMGIGPVSATRKALDRAGLRTSDIAIFEVNEAFASVAVAIGNELKLPAEKVNPLGGAIALGHPIGATGAILVVKLLHELARRQERYGVVTLCIGGGMGIAAVFERVE
ncbi:MAG TPA: thiolase family protein [Ktedonobacterales bacterium]|nr:thiolase family protein [Ktedonobacterales bacterium]